MSVEEKARKKIPGLRLFGIVVLFLVGISYRLTIIYPLPIGQDSISYATQAFYILKGHFFIFYPGQAWMGSAGSYVLALLYKLMGVSTTTIGLFAWSMSCLLLFTSIILAYYLFGLNTALITSLLFMIPKKTIMQWTSQARPDYEICFFLVPVILLLTYKFIMDFEKKKSLKRLSVCLGFLSGFGFWNNMSIGPAVIISLFLIMINLKTSFLKKLLPLYISGGLIGFLPVIYYNVFHDFIFFNQTTTFTNLTRLPKIIQAFFTNAFPFFWGISFSETDSLWLKIIFFVFLLWVIFLYGLALYQAVQKWKLKENILRYQLIFGYFFLHLWIASTSAFGNRFMYDSYPTAYITILYSVALLIPAAAIDSLVNKKLKVLFLLPFSVFIINNFFHTFEYPERFYKAIKEQGLSAIRHFPEQNHVFLLWAQDKGLSSGYGHARFKDGINFDCLGKIVCSDFHIEPYLFRALEVDAAKEIFWIDPPPDTNLKVLGCDFKTDTVLDHHVDYDFKKDFFLNETLLSDMKVSTSTENHTSHFLLDRNITTYWKVDFKETKNESIFFSFKEPVKIHKMVIIPQDYISGPNRFYLETSPDGKTWKKVLDMNSTPPLFWSVLHPFIKLVKPRLEFSLPSEEKISYLRLVIDIKEDDRFQLSIREIYFYTKIDETKLPREKLKQEIELIAAEIFKKYKKSTIIADHWFVNFFKLFKFKTDFISNRFVNNCGKENPNFRNLIPVDFSKATVIIAEKSHTPSVEAKLKQHKISYEKRDFGFYNLLTSQPVRHEPQLYWNGLELNSVNVPKRNLRHWFSYPPLHQLFAKTIASEFLFENKFKISSYFLEYLPEEKVIDIYLEVFPLCLLKNDYSIFIHFCDAQGKIVFQGDFEMNNPVGKTSSWTPGKNIILFNRVKIPHDIPEKLSVKLGIWDQKSGNRLLTNSPEKDHFKVNFPL